jgi:CheY-like chemotaxis protein
MTPMQHPHGSEQPAPRILMFEDSETTMGGLRDYLQKRYHWSVDLTADQSILQRLGEVRYDLILLDVMIHTQDPATAAAGPREPDARQPQNVHFEGVSWRMTGLRFLQCLRRGEYDSGAGTPPDAPVIIVSAALTSSVKSELEQDRNVYGVFEKPFVLSELVKAIQAALEAKRA